MNNKTALIKICFVIAAVLAAGSAYASSAITSSTTIGGGTFAPSNNVRINATATSTAYAATSQHLNGSRLYFGNNSDPKIYWGTVTPGTFITVTMNATDTSITGYTTPL